MIPREHLLDDYVSIRHDCASIREAAVRMGVGFARLDMALYRARRDGDTRGVAPFAQRERALDQGRPFASVAA